MSFQVRAQTMPGLARFFTAGRGITAPEPGRTTAPYWVTTTTEARKAVHEDAAKRVDIIKIWVDDRMGTVKKLSPEIYRAVIDEAHKNGLRVIAHIYTLEDAKGTLRAGLDAFAHGVRDKDLDDEFITLVKQHQNLVLGPNMPDRVVVADIDWLRQSLPTAEFERLQTGNTNRPDAHAFWSIQARNLAKMSAAGARIVVGTDGNTPYAPHVEMADMVAAGMTPITHVWRVNVAMPTSTPASTALRRVPARAATIAPHAGSSARWAKLAAWASVGCSAIAPATSRPAAHQPAVAPATRRAPYARTIAEAARHTAAITCNGRRSRDAVVRNDPA